MSKPTVGIFGLTGCAGDQLVILNCEDRLLDVVALLDIRDFLMASSEIDAACPLDIALVEGAVFLFILIFGLLFAWRKKYLVWQ